MMKRIPDHCHLRSSAGLIDATYLCADVVVWLTGSGNLCSIIKSISGIVSPRPPDVLALVLTGLCACRDFEKEASQKQRDARPALDKVKLAEDTVEAADDQVKRAQEYAQSADEELKAAMQQLR